MIKPVADSTLTSKILTRFEDHILGTTRRETGTVKVDSAAMQTFQPDLGVPSDWLRRQWDFPRRFFSTRE